MIRDKTYLMAKKIVENYEKNQNHLKPSFWFMRDNHTFIKPKGKTAKEVKDDLIAIAKENPYGMVCSVTILEEGQQERSIGNCYHVDDNGYVNLDKWYEEVIKEECVRNYAGETE